MTIGAYDGVHRGHRAVIANVKRLAAERGLATAVVTFDRHPASVVRPESAPLLLTDLDQKLELLEETGVDYTVVIHFDEARSQESAEDFVNEVLVQCLNAKLVVVGRDFHFGHRRRGNVALLEEMGGAAGLRGDRPRSGRRRRSSRDRRTSRCRRPPSAPRSRRVTSRRPTSCSDGRTKCAASSSTVTIGGGRSAFRPPTSPSPRTRCFRPTGSTRSWYERPSGEVVPGAASLGRRPTFYESQPFRLLEVHLLDWDGDLYGEQAKVSFVARLREEMKFDSRDALVDQMHRDCEDALRLLAG